VAAHLADKAAPGFECPPDTGEDGFRRAHPMQRRIRKHRVELGVESKILPAHDTCIDAAGSRRGDHAVCRVDDNDCRPSGDNFLGQHIVAAARVEDPLTGGWGKELEHRCAKLRHEGRCLGITSSRPVPLGSDGHD
jgi:hypothetical protein